VMVTGRSARGLTGALQRPGARGGLGIERLESSMSRSLTRRIAWRALAPAAEG
jgi:hypothetical protein